MQILRKILALTLALTLTLSMGAVAAFAAEPDPTAELDITDSTGEYFDPKWDKAVKGETYDLAVSYYDDSNPDFDPEKVEVTWEITKATPAGVATLGTPGGDYDNGYTNQMTINDYGRFTLTIKVKASETSMNTITTTIVTEPDPNAPFFFTNFDEYGVEYEDSRTYPGETMSTRSSINRGIKSWRLEDFVSTKLPVSVSCDSASYEFKLDNVLQKNDKFYGSILQRVKKEPTDKVEWAVEDIGKEFKTGMTITFADKSSAKYNFFTRMTQTPTPNLLTHENEVEAGKTYTQKFEVIDKKDVLTDATDIIADWDVKIGKNNVMLGASSVIRKAVGTKTPLENTVKFTGRGAVVMDVDFKNSPLISGDDNNMHSSYELTYIVKGDAAPMAPGDIVAAPGSDGTKTIIEVSSSNNLDAAAIKKIKDLAEAAGSDRIELKLGEVSMGIGVSGLTNPDFLAAVGRNGGVFDPLITLAAPAEAAVANIQTDGGRWFDFAHSGKLPGESTISLNVGSFFGDAENLVLWYFNKATGKMEKQEEIAVDYDKESGNCSFKLDHCSAWALYPDIDGFSPNGDGSTPEKDDSGSSRGSSSSAPSYPTAEKGLADLAKIKDLTAANLPLNAKLTKTAAGKDIAVIPVTLIDGRIGVFDLNMLGKLGANVGLEIKQSGADIIIPGGFGAVTEVGRFAYFMQLNKLAANSADMLAAVKGTGALSYTCTIGSDVTLPTTATVTLTTDIKKDSDVNVYRYNTATGKPVFVAKGKLAGGKVVFATKQLGQFMVTSGTV